MQGFPFGFPAFSIHKHYSNEQFGFVPVSVCMVNCAQALFVMQFLLALCFRCSAPFKARPAPQALTWSARKLKRFSRPVLPNR
jgi:hypothetical protein